MEIVGETYRSKQIKAVVGRTPKLDEEVEQQHEAHLIPEPDNPHDSNAISVRIKDHVVGYLSREDALAYVSVLHRIAASGHKAVTSARVWATTSRSWTDEKRTDFRSRISIYMPAPEHIVPLNMRSSEGVALLPWGGALQVTGEEKHFSYLFNYVPVSGEGLVILTLHKLVHALKNGTERELVEVRLDGERVGQLTAATSAHYLPSIGHAEDVGRILGVWAKLKGSGLAAELIIQGARATDLPDSWLKELPSLPALIAEGQSYLVPEAFSEAERSSVQDKARSAAPVQLKPDVQPAAMPRKVMALTPADRKHSPTVHRAAGVSMIVLMVVVGALLGLIPGVGPVLFVACVAFGIYANVKRRKTANQLESEPAP